jgi:DNA-binding NarL/FixJ family response regulator
VRAGARGFVTEDIGAADLRRAVATIGAGGAMFGPGLLPRLLAAPPPELTARERAVLELFTGGDPASAVARRLDIAPKTLRNHVSAIRGKLGVRDLGTVHA